MRDNQHHHPKVDLKVLIIRIDEGLVVDAAGQNRIEAMGGIIVAIGSGQGDGLGNDVIAQGRQIRNFLAGHRMIATVDPREASNEVVGERKALIDASHHRSRLDIDRRRPMGPGVLDAIILLDMGKKNTPLPPRRPHHSRHI